MSQHGPECPLYYATERCECLPGAPPTTVEGETPAQRLANGVQAALRNNAIDGPDRLALTDLLEAFDNAGARGAGATP